MVVATLLLFWKSCAQHDVHFQRMHQQEVAQPIADVPAPPLNGHTSCRAANPGFTPCPAQSYLPSSCVTAPYNTNSNSNT
jgi:hypothetical protein